MNWQRTIKARVIVRGQYLLVVTRSICTTVSMKGGIEFLTLTSESRSEEDASLSWDLPPHEAVDVYCSISPKYKQYFTELADRAKQALEVQDGVCVRNATCIGRYCMDDVTVQNTWTTGQATEDIREPRAISTPKHRRRVSGVQGYRSTLQEWRAVVWFRRRSEHKIRSSTFSTFKNCGHRCSYSQGSTINFPAYIYTLGEDRFRDITAREFS